MFQRSTDTSTLANAAISMFQFVVEELQPVMHDTQLTPSQLSLLLFVARQATSPTMTDIARHMQYSTAAGTGSVDRLVKLGFLERSHATDDRRKICVCLTPKGREFLTNAQTLCGERLASIMDNPRNPRERGIQDILLAMASN
jgi:DNA-binding MarR family transcriptional regulator